MEQSPMTPVVEQIMYNVINNKSNWEKLSHIHKDEEFKIAVEPNPLDNVRLAMTIKMRGWNWWLVR